MAHANKTDFVCRMNGGVHLAQREWGSFQTTTDCWGVRMNVQRIYYL